MKSKFEWVLLAGMSVVVLAVISGLYMIGWAVQAWVFKTVLGL